MIINKLRLKGWIGVKYGLGLDEVTLDLSGISGLIVLSGENGSSKSTILENLQPYRALVSRSRALQYHTFMRDSVKELDFDFQGDNYKTKILIDADSGRQEGYLWKNGESMIDGKVSNYDKYITELLGSKDLFFNSIFCAQNSSKLSSLTPGNLKRLFVEFLRQKETLRHEETVSRMCLMKLQTQEASLQRQRDNIETRILEIGDLEKAGKEAGEVVTLNKTFFADCTFLVKETENEIEAAQKIKANVAILEGEVKGLALRIQDKEKLREDAKNQAYAKNKELLTILQKTEKDIERQDALMEDEDKILTAIDELPAIEEKASRLKERVMLCKDKVTKWQVKTADKELKIIRIKGQRHPEADSIIHKQEALKALRGLSAGLEKRPEQCVINECHFIQSALEAVGQITRVEAELLVVKSEVLVYGTQKANDLRILEEAKRQDGVEEANARKELSSEVLKLSGMTGLICSLGVIASREVELREAKARREHAVEREQELTDELGSLSESAGIRDNMFTIEIETLNREKREIETKVDIEVKDRVSTLRSKLDETQRYLEEYRVAISEAEATLAQIQAKKQERDELRSQRTDLDKKIAETKREFGEWFYLKTELPKLRALEIKNVSPLISEYANDVLFETFGPGFSARLRTENDEGEDVLDIVAVRENGVEVLVDDLSGGQAVWQLKALRLGMTLVANEKSGKEFGSVFADEEDGALDAENAQHFILMYRKFMERGEFENCYFISHRAKCVAMADHRILFNGGIQID
ncbi:MAG TPA: hypothetical protein ENH07_10260 [Nitrospirae bacterium]|nr:hypothetical protein [Nitrospirota bacterium]